MVPSGPGLGLLEVEDLEVEDLEVEDLEVEDLVLEDMTLPNHYWYHVSLSRTGRKKGIWQIGN